jgi:hypothetical protein
VAAALTLAPRHGASKGQSLLTGGTGVGAAPAGAPWEVDGRRAAPSPLPLDAQEVTLPRRGERRECPNGRWLVSEGRGARFAPCRGRRCESDWCHRAWARNVSRRIVAGIEGAGGLGPGVVFLTVTAPAEVGSVPAWNESCPRRFAAALRVLRRRAPGLEYVRVLEMQEKRGKRTGQWLLHVHAVVTGWEFVPADILRAVFMSQGFGPRFDIGAVRTGGGIAGYVASRYLAKSRLDLGGAYRVVQYSRGWPSGEDPDDVIWRRAMNAVDPVVVIRDGESWWDWAGRQDGAETLFGGGAGDAFAYVRPP